MLQDNLVTLVYPAPLSILVHSAFGGKRMDVWFVVSHLFMHLVWIIRSFFLPIAAALGTANLMSTANTAVDVVLNSVAVAFVFDLDELAYESLISRRCKKEYLASPSRLPPMLQPTAQKLDSNFGLAWICYVVDLTFVIVVYLYAVFQWPFRTSPQFDDANQKLLFALYCGARGVLWAIIHIYRVLQAMRRMRRANKPTGPPAALAVRLLLGVAIYICSGLIAYAICWEGLHPSLGSISGLAAVLHGSPLHECLELYASDSNCAANQAMIVTPF